MGDTQITNYSTIARDCGVSSHTIKNYYEILGDTLLGSNLPAFQKAAKRRVVKSPKFYFFDNGIVNQLASRIPIRPKTPDFGRAFESWVFHELNCFNKYREKHLPLAYWRTESGFEVDFIVDNMALAIECKSAATIKSDDLKSLRELAREHRVGKRFLVYTGDELRTTEDGIQIVPYRQFINRLWQDELF